VSDRLRLSIVIPTFQRCASVRRLLDALTHQTVSPGTFEVIVAIDGSTDGTKEMVDGCQAPYPLRSVWQANRGRAAARNSGIRLAQGRVVVFLDDDMEPAPGCLLAHLDAHPPGSRRAVIGPAPIPVDPSSPPIVRYRSEGMEAHLARLARLARLGAPLGFRDMYSGNLSLPLEVLRELGGFDEAFSLYGHEDYELALRLIKAGVELSYRPEAVALQHYEKDFASYAQDCLARGQTAVLFARKHPEVTSSPQLAGYRLASPGWKWARSLMLLASWWLPTFPQWVVRAMTWLEQRRPRRLPGLYRRSLDYFFWVGAQSALRTSPQPGLQRLRRIGLGLLILFAIGSSLRLAAREVRRLEQQRGPDEITRYDARFHGLRSALPPLARVGYVTDPPRQARDEAESARLAFKDFLLVQYALLPAILTSEQRGLVVGSFDSAPGPGRATDDRRTVVRDFGNGVVLFRDDAE
jgi:glycosyltransferase involved in cell wall biosynthesis